METEAKKRHLPFQTANARLNSRYGIKLDEDEFIEKAYYIWRSIGNIATRVQRIVVTVPSDLVVELPQGIEFVKSVTTINNTGIGDYKSNSSGRITEIKPDVSAISLESAAKSSELYAHGDPVNYTLTSDSSSMFITSKTMMNREILIIYSAIAQDESGLPLLNDKEVEAITSNLALQDAEKDLFMNKKGADRKVAYMQPIAERLLLSARISEKITDNQIDKVLDIKTSWDRKSFGSKFNYTF